MVCCEGKIRKGKKVIRICGQESSGGVGEKVMNEDRWERALW